MGNTSMSAGLAGPGKAAPAVTIQGQSTARNELSAVLWQFRREFLLAALASAGVNLLMLTPTLYMMQVYDRVMVSQNVITLVVVSMLAVALYLLMALGEWVRSRLLVGCGVRIDERLGTRVFNASFEQHLAGMSDPARGPGRAFSDLLQVRQFITGHGVISFFDLPWVPLYLAVMFLLHPVLGWVSIAFAVVQAGLAWLGHHRSLEPAEAAQLAQTEESSDLQGKLRNAEVLESMGMVANLRRRWALRHERTIELQHNVQSQTHAIMAVSKFVRYIQQSASLAVGALLVVDGELSPGAMIAANVLMSRALAPIDSVVMTWKSFITAREAFGRLGLLLAQHPERDPALRRAAPKGHLTLRDVEATAPGRAVPILRNVGFELTPGTVLAVVGPSGSGKSTLARVILGIWGDVRGEVLLDGRPIDGWDRDDLGPHIGYLPQDIELFDGSIAENISRFGELDSAAVIAAAQAAGLHEMILRFPRGYDTPMGEAGNLLSGGQRQRIALARAVYGMPALIVLDEPNANLDDTGEVALARAILDLKARGSAVILITHRQGALAVADRLLVLQEGRVTHEGPRDTVLAALRPTPQNPS